MIREDLDGHVGTTKDGCACHGGFGYGTRNEAGKRIFVFVDESHNLAIANTRSRKRASQLVYYYSAYMKTQIDFVLENIVIRS